MTESDALWRQTWSWLSDSTPIELADAERVAYYDADTDEVVVEFNDMAEMRIDGDVADDYDSLDLILEMMEPDFAEQVAVTRHDELTK